MNKKFCDKCGKEIIKNSFTNLIGNGKLEIEMLSGDDYGITQLKEFDLCKECCKKYLDENKKYE